MNRFLEESADDPHSAVRVACLRLMLARLGFEPAPGATGNAQRLLMSLQATVHDAARVNTAELAMLCTELGITQNWLGDLLHAEANLRAAYGGFAELAAACAAFCDTVNARPHTETRRPPAEMIAEERPDGIGIEATLELGPALKHHRLVGHPAALIVEHARLRAVA